MRFSRRNTIRRGSQRGGLLPGILTGLILFTLLTAGFSALISKGSLASDSGRLLSRLAFGAAVFTACWLTVRGCAGKRLLWSLLCGGILCACALLSALLPGTAEFHPAAVCGISALAAGIGAVLGSRQKRKIL